MMHMTFNADPQMGLPVKHELSLMGALGQESSITSQMRFVFWASFFMIAGGAVGYALGVDRTLSKHGR